MSEIKLGIYRHYKGPLYQVLGIAHDANADTFHRALDAGGDFEYVGQRTVVVYMPLQLDGAHLGPRMAVRTLADFTATLPLTQDGFEIAGSRIPRFEYLGPELTAEMIP